MRINPLVFVLAALWPSIAGAQGAAAAKPNIVLVITDDMGWADLSSYGATDVKTPNIDSLARDGVRLTDFYANGVLCTPTRAGLISGRYQQRVGLEQALSNPNTPSGQLGLPADGRSLPQLLKNAGYATALVGKWHLGYKPEFSPNAHGFDYFFGLKSGYHDYYQHNGNDGNLDLWENDKPVEITGYTTDLITERSLKFIEQHAGRPFFIDVAYNAPHWPYQPPDKPSVAANKAAHLLPGDSPLNTRADYVAMVERVDRGVGEILTTLARLNLTNNTIVIFTNDNGGEWLSNNGPLFNRKWTVWEGGIRVPAIVKWPGQIPAGKVSDQLGITMDLTASILAAAGVSEPRLEGIDLFPILAGRAPQIERTLFWRTNVGGQSQKAVRRGDWKLVVDGTHVFVFNIRADIGERQDLAHQQQDRARDLRALLAAWEKGVDAEASRLARKPQ
jgi:arylsulfatase A-like enzyme